MLCWRRGGGERTRKVSAELIKMSIIIDEMRIFCAVDLHMLWRVGEKQMTDWMIEIDAIESCVVYKYKKKLRQSTEYRESVPAPEGTASM